MPIRYNLSTLTGTPVEIFDAITNKKITERESMSKTSRYLGFKRGRQLDSYLRTGEYFISKLLNKKVYIKKKV